MQCNMKRQFICHQVQRFWVQSQLKPRAVRVCVCRGAQLFFYLGAEVREREVSRLLTWSLGSGANTWHQSRTLSFRPSS